MQRYAKISIVLLSSIVFILFLGFFFSHKLSDNWLNGNWKNINDKQEQYTFTKTNHTLVIILPNQDEIKTK